MHPSQGKKTEVEQGRQADQQGTSPTDGGLGQLTVSLAERQARARALFDDAACDEVDARVAAAEAAGEPAPESRAFQGPDPLGVGWAWAGATDKPQK